jgi:hypothetical protein
LSSGRLGGRRLSRRWLGSRRLGRRGTRATASEDGRARDDVAVEWLVDVDLHTWVGTLVRAGEAHCGGVGTAAASDTELSALHVELGAGVVAGRVEG